MAVGSSAGFPVERSERVAPGAQPVEFAVETADCVLPGVPLQIAHLMRRHATHTHAGLNLSVRALLSALAGIQETVLLYQGERGRPRARRMTTDQATQTKLYEIFDLDRYAPRR